MKATGIVRTLDELGRFGLPIELRRTLGIAEGAPLEIYVEGETIILKIHTPGCVFCEEADEETMVTLEGRWVCKSCLEELNELR